MGLSYKPNTNVLEASQSLMLAEKLGDAGYEVTAYDPSGAGVPARKCKMAKSAEECIASAEVCILATPWKEFSEIPVEKFAGKIVLDLWRLFAGRLEGMALKYIPVGRGLDSGKEFPAEYIAGLGGFEEPVASR